MFKKLLPFLVIGSIVTVGSMQAAPGTGVHSLKAKVAPVEQVEKTQDDKTAPKDSKKIQVEKTQENKSEAKLAKTDEKTKPASSEEKTDAKK